MENGPIHINAQVGDIAPIVLMPGDPLRAKYIANNFLKEAKEVTNLRNMLGFTGLYKDKLVTVIGSGMGMPSMGIYAYELFKFYNVNKIIRIGTCGVNSPKINVPELILAQKSYTESNFALSFNGVEEHIAYPSESLNDLIIQTSQDLGYKLHVGDIITMDVFGPYADSEGILRRANKELEIIGEEMESFALFYLANLFKKEAACLLTAVDSKYSDKIVSSIDREKNLNDMIKLALETITK